VTITLAVVAGRATGRVLNLKVQNFINPASTSPLTGNTATLSTSASVTRFTSLSSQGSINSLTPDVMVGTPTIVSSSDVIGQANTVATISFTPKNFLRSNGMIKVTFPAWSTGNPPAYYLASNPTCRGIKGMVSSLRCDSVDVPSTMTTILTIYNPVTGDTRGSELSFTVTGFRNPYSQKPRTGFIIETYDNSLYGKIDTSGSNAIKVQVNTWATFTSTPIVSISGDNTVGELNDIDFDISLQNWPFDAGCRLKVYFPSEMPATTDIN
jgi:hypothetical protein